MKTDELEGCCVDVASLIKREKVGSSQMEDSLQQAERKRREGKMEEKRKGRKSREDEEKGRQQR